MDINKTEYLLRPSLHEAFKLTTMLAETEKEIGCETFLTLNKSVMCM